MNLATSDVPVMPRGVRLHEDKVRNRWVLLAPERAISLDPVGHAILLEIDGSQSFGGIVSTLAGKYNAPEDQIAADVAEFINGLMDRCILKVLG
ncbi:MAG: pyrroloquinoline quinone biosynthesis peptide chaperone PqqD [Pseudomonadota bacterium]